MKQDIFNYTMSEWKKQEVNFMSSVVGGKQSSLFYCPACGTEPHCIHIDGNAKLFRYDRGGR